MTTTATGSLGDIDFNDAQITLFGIGDTDDVEMDGSLNFLRENFVAYVDIEGPDFSAPVQFSDTIQAVSNNNSELGGFGNTTNSEGLFFIFNGAFETYDLTSDLGPISGLGFINTGTRHATAAGDFVVTSHENFGTFTATVSQVPEPGSAIVLGVVSSLLIRRRSELRR